MSTPEKKENDSEFKKVLYYQNIFENLREIEA
jgi:hypothetical protein